MTANPAAQQGWVKSTDPNTGKVFYANHVTRKTQWEPPTNWVEVVVAAPSPPPLPPLPSQQQLPPGWEEMHDPTTGKAFYVDHERQITQWERPVAVVSTASSSSLARAPAAAVFSSSSSNNNKNAYQHQRERTYSSEAAYYMQPKTAHSHDTDWSDSLPHLEFTVQTVPDSLRSACPQCDTVFSMRLRRHHCRLCADVICDNCSTHRVELPLAGAEFEKGPVRVCDYCHQDVEMGNFFSMRRYLTILLLDNGGSENAMSGDGNVNAALSGLRQDLDQMINSGDSVADKVTIPAYVLVPAILKQLLHNRDTADRAVACLASLLSLEKLAGVAADFTTVVFQSVGVIDQLLEVLERTNTDRRSLYVQEQAAKVLFFITESKITVLNDDISIDMRRAFRCLLDHTSSPNPNLPRWSAAVVQNLILEDQRRAVLSINEVAAKLAAGVGMADVTYESKLAELIDSGGLMMLGSLMSNDDDADARAHAVSACSAALASARAVQNAQTSLQEMAGTPVTVDAGQVVRAIVQAGGCGSSVAQLILSADTAVTNMGVAFLLGLVRPLMAAVDALPRQYEYASDHSGLGASREAALEIATGSALPALVSLIGSDRRSLELRCMAMECLATTCMAVGEMGQSWANGMYEEGLERYAAPGKLKDGIVLLNEERVVDCALQVLQSDLGQSLGSSGGKETPATRIREGAGLLLSSITSCSAEAVMELANRNILSSLLLAASDSSMTAPSTIKADGSPRCLGVLDTVASLLMFSWQHPSGSSKGLLDTLIEMIDAGAIPFISKVMMARVEWESRSKAVGGMKGRTAACRFLCCLFGIALTDATGIGMRRLMDAVESDSHLYRSNVTKQQQQQQNRKVPSNVMEATLGGLQTSANLAREVLVGDSQSEYSSALMNLVEASLLAAGSICGSSIAPGGSEGVMVTSESFLASRSDDYVAIRKGLCSLACDVVVRGGKGSTPLLPTMMVGGFGEGCILASLRMALAIAQNGSPDQHAKLALSGILVPISDLLRSALSSGDIYKFSSSLAIIRFCGPHVAAGHGGGLESVRDAIKVATKVLALPVNLHATEKQQQSQETLKAECVSALESLSRNASLWNTISTDALPAVVQYLHVSSTARDARSTATVCAALRAVLQIVQVPSHAVSAAETGIVSPLSALLHSGEPTADIPMLSLKVLHAIGKNDEARARAQFLQAGLVTAICALLAKSSSFSSAESGKIISEIVHLGLEIVLFSIVDAERGLSVDQLLQAPTSAAFLSALTADPAFIRSLCSTMMASTGMKIHTHREDAVPTEIPPIYGPPLMMVKKQCGEFESTHAAADAVFFTMAVFACGLENPNADAFWAVFQLVGYSGDEKDATRVSAALAAQFLSLLSREHKPFVPLQSQKQEGFLTIIRPLVRHKLLEILKAAMAALSADSADKFMTDVLVGFNVPHLCLDLWKDPALLDIAYAVIEQIVEQDPDEVLHLFVETKEAMISLFDLLNLGSDFDTAADVGSIRRFLANVLAQLAESGLLSEAVVRLDARSSAIAALAAACLSEEERIPDEDEDVTESRLAAVLMKCLVDLCTVQGTEGVPSSIKLSSIEAMALSRTLGKKICHMVLSRFLERSKLQQYEIDDEDRIIEAPDVAMLCAIAQHDEALVTLRSVGGLHALSLIAAEGELSALQALQKACDGDASVLLEGDTYSSMMGLLAKGPSDPDDVPTARKKLETLTYELLTKLVSGSQKGRAAVMASASCEGCVVAAMDVFSGGVVASLPNPDSDIENDAEMAAEESDANDEVKDATMPTVKKVASCELQPLDSVDIDRKVAASAFLASLGRTKVVQQKAIASEDFMEALKSIAITSPNIELQYAALSLMSDLATSAFKDGTLSSSMVAEVLKHFLSIDQSFMALKTANANQVYFCAATLFTIVIDDMALDDQVHLSLKFVELFKRSCRSCIVCRTAPKASELVYAAELAYTLTNILLVVRGKPYVDEMFTAEVISCLAQLIQWRKDPKTTLPPGTEDTWDAAVDNCLIVLSLVLWRPDHGNKNMDIKAVAASQVMLVRPGKAPRKAIDLKSALERFTGPSSITAKRLIARLYY